jgi:hypothetical protein
LDFDAVRTLALLFTPIFLLILAGAALLAVQPRSWK